MKYIKLSNGKVGYIENEHDKRFISDLKRLNLTYEEISCDEWTFKSMTQQLKPEQVYKLIGGKKEFDE